MLYVSSRGALFKRLLTAAIVAPLLITFIIHGGIVAFTALIIIAIMLGIRELYNILERGGTNRKAASLSGFIAGAALPLAVLWYGIAPSSVPAYFFPFLIWIFVVTSIVQVLRNSSDSLHNVTVTFLSILYISWCLSHVIMLRILNPYCVISVLFITWIGDSGAYLSGKLFGKHKLARRISPGKSIEGVVGAILFGLIATLLSKWFLSKGGIFLTTMQCVVLGLILGGMTVLGDLVESAMKRKARMKDSGNLLPGYGGILDVIDSLLFTAPAMYYYLKFTLDFL